MKNNKAFGLSIRLAAAAALGFAYEGITFARPVAISTPKAVVISLDGATPRIIDNYLATGVLPPNRGIGLLKNKGVYSRTNQTVTPSLTAVAHTAIATGSTAAHNDIPANTFSLVASPWTPSFRTISGFGAAIGGYCIDCGAGGAPAISPSPTAVPLWVGLRAAGLKVVTATWPGGDGATITAPGVTPAATIQTAVNRTVDYTVPFGASLFPFETAFSLTSASFSTASSTVINQLTAAGLVSYSPVKAYSLETLTVSGSSVTKHIQVAALDTTNDGFLNYDTLVFFSTEEGVVAGPLSAPHTGSAIVRASDKISSPFFIEGSANKSATAYYVSRLEPDLSLVHIARYSPTYIPRAVAPGVLANVDDINNNVGAWGHQPDFYFPERLIPQVATFTDEELESIYADQLNQWVKYQGDVAIRAMRQVPDADLVMTYIEQPDGSCHQFLLTDPRQASNPKDPNTIGAGQDLAKVARYQGYVKNAYVAANEAVQRIIDEVGVDANGIPRKNIFVVSDHGFDIFHTAVNMNQILANAGIPGSQVRAVTSGPAVNLYINLQGRTPGGTVTPAAYLVLQDKLRRLLHGLVDTNPNYLDAGSSYNRVFQKIYSRPVTSIVDPSFGRDVSPVIGQDSGDVVGILLPGYNFDGVQSPVVVRKGDTANATPVFSVPNFYGAHGYDPSLPNMSAVLYAAGPDIKAGAVLPLVHNIDIAPTLDFLFGVVPPATMDGVVIPLFNH